MRESSFHSNVSRRVIRLSKMPNHPGKHTWWNGIGIFVLNKD